jgi:tetratricopeptide (TPR) repeat protein
MSWPVAQEYTCPLCGEKNKTYTVAMSDNFGGEDSELRSYPVGFDPLRFALYTCGACGFTDYLFEVDKTIPEPEKNAIEKYLTAIPRETIKFLHSYAPYAPEHGEDEKYALSKYMLLLDILKIRVVSAFRMATAFLEAAWTVDEVADADTAYLKTDLRREALKSFENALTTNEIRDQQEQEKLKYLIGELYRRLGRFKEAIGYYSRVKSKEAWLNDQAKAQIKRARKKDASLVKYKPKPLFEGM